VRTDEAADAAVVDEWDAAFQKLIDADIPVIIRSPSGRVSPPEAAILCLSSDAAVAVPDKAVSSKRRYAVVLNGMETEETLRNLVEKAFVKFFILRPEKFAGSTYIEAGRKVGNLMNKWRAKQPIILDFETKRSENWEYDLIYGAVLMGAVLVDGFAQGVLWQQRRLDSFSLLQACRLRASKTEFISCPSCGRTLFDLQQTTERIKQRTGHLPGVRIAVMGCIVNGPGEMADADFGFVGSLPGKVDLYYGKNCVRRGVDYADADEVLVQLIKDHGLWKDPLPA
jgi:(E)-4-hydroxy-3-methylbut-2-enyl-diphosphate synthase